MPKLVRSEADRRDDRDERRERDEHARAMSSELVNDVLGTRSRLPRARCCCARLARASRARLLPARRDARCDLRALARRHGALNVSLVLVATLEAAQVGE